jgi:hypothetical protein
MWPQWNRCSTVRRASAPSRTLIAGLARQLATASANWDQSARIRYTGTSPGNGTAGNATSLNPFSSPSFGDPAMLLRNGIPIPPVWPVFSAGLYPIPGTLTGPSSQRSGVADVTDYARAKSFTSTEGSLRGKRATAVEGPHAHVLAQHGQCEFLLSPLHGYGIAQQCSSAPISRPRDLDAFIVP